jgi:hypothetical protein
MTAVEVIQKVREKINRNALNDNTGFDLARIITAVNEAQNKFLEYVIEKKNEDDIRLIQKLAVPSLKLKRVEDDEFSQFFELPENYFDFINVEIKAKKDKCKDYLIANEIKMQNQHLLIRDTNNSPSFFYRETFYYISEDKLRVFKTDFEIVESLLTYYRYPVKIDVEGYFDIEGNPSSNIDPEWGDKEMDRIISIAVKDLNINSENLNKIQADMLRINNEF